MRPCGIALVDVKAILGVLLRHFQHKVVPGDLGKHRRRCDIGAEAVPLDHGFYRYPEILFPVSVDQNEVRALQASCPSARSMARNVACKIFISSMFSSSTVANPIP